MALLTVTLISCELGDSDCGDDVDIDGGVAADADDSCDGEDMGSTPAGEVPAAGDTVGGDSAGDEGGSIAGLEGGSAGIEGGDSAGNEGGSAGIEGGSAGIEGGDMAGSEGGESAGSEGGEPGGSPMVDDGWQVYQHPCVGNRTDALHCDDKLTCYVGCGTTTNGRGAYVTTDGGMSWQPIQTNPSDILAGARVNDISRSSDGKLYFAGEIANDTRVVAMDDQGNLSEVFNRRAQSDFSFTPGSFRRSESGRAIAESLTGAGLVYRNGDSDDPTGSWESGRGFSRDGDADDVAAGVQILSLDVLGDDFYGVGSTINTPNTVFLPKWEGDDFDFHIVQFNSEGLGAFIGELWDIEAGREGIVAGGVNQSADKGVVYAHPGGESATDPSTWSFFDVSTLLPDQATWVSGVCMGAEGIFAVGRESRETWGFVMRSTDGGSTYQDLTPRDADNQPYFPDISRCTVKGGALIVAGAGGLFAVYDRF